MKFVVVLSVLFASICMCQAYELDIFLFTVYYEKVPTKGQLTLTLQGDTKNKVVDFGKQKFDHVIYLKTKTDFSEEIKNFTIHWEAESKKFIYLNFLDFKVDGAKDSDRHLLYKNIESGTSETFNRNV